MAVGRLAALSAGLIPPLVDLVGELCARITGGAVLAVGVDGAAWWCADDEGAHSRFELCDAARLAEATGQNIIDAFADRDLAGGGSGGPIDALAKWVVLHDSKQSRCLVDLGSTVRLLYLPAAVESSGARRVMATDAAPGTALLARLASRWPGKPQHGLREQLASQGKPIIPILDELLAAEYLRSLPPRWHPQGVSPEGFAETLLHGDADGKPSLSDALCTAAHFIAEATARCILQHVPKTPPLDAVVLTGAGADDAFLMDELRRRLSDVSICTLKEIYAQADYVDAAAAAVLTSLHIDQVPATHTLTTGVAVPRVLGRLTPGAPTAWQRLLRHLAANVPARMSLRSAM